MIFLQFKERVVSQGETKCDQKTNVFNDMKTNLCLLKDPQMPHIKKNRKKKKKSNFLDHFSGSPSFIQTATAKRASCRGLPFGKTRAAHDNVFDIVSTDRVVWKCIHRVLREVLCDITHSVHF